MPKDRFESNARPRTQGTSALNPELEERLAQRRMERYAMQQAQGKPRARRKKDYAHQPRAQEQAHNREVSEARHKMRLHTLSLAGKVLLTGLCAAALVGLMVQQISLQSHISQIGLAENELKKKLDAQLMKNDELSATMGMGMDLNEIAKKARSMGLDFPKPEQIERITLPTLPPKAPETTDAANP